MKLFLLQKQIEYNGTLKLVHVCQMSTDLSAYSQWQNNRFNHYWFFTKSIILRFIYCFIVQPLLREHLTHFELLQNIKQLSYT